MVRASITIKMEGDVVFRQDIPELIDTVENMITFATPNNPPFLSYFLYIVLTVSFYHQIYFS